MRTDFITEWRHISQLLAETPSLWIPTFVENRSKGENQLLMFCDSSMKSYATVIYLRVKDDVNFSTNLLFSKMRLVPVDRGKRKNQNI